MSSKHERSLKLNARVASSDDPRAKAEHASSAPTHAAHSTAHWGSAPIVLERIEVRCGDTGANPSHHDPFIFLAAIERNCGLLFHFEIHRRTRLPTVEAFVGRAEAAFPTELLRKLLNPPQDGSAV